MFGQLRTGVCVGMDDLNRHRRSAQVAAGTRSFRRGDGPTSLGLAIVDAIDRSRTDGRAELPHVKRNDQLDYD